MTFCNPLLATAMAAVLAASTLPAAAQGPDPGAVARDMIHRSNAFRSDERLPPVTPQPALTAAAQAFADYMARTDRYGHEADGRAPVDRARAKGYDHCMVAENIAMQYRSNGFSGPELARGFVQGWIDSPGHRQNLLSDMATDIGLAVAQSPSSGRWYAVQMFGRPMSRAVRFEVSNHSRTALRYSLDDKAHALLPGMTRSHQTCSPPAFTMGLPGSDPVRLRPENGAKFRVEAGVNGLRLVQG